MEDTKVLGALLTLNEFCTNVEKCGLCPLYNDESNIEGHHCRLMQNTPNNYREVVNEVSEPITTYKFKRKE